MVSDDLIHDLRVALPSLRPSEQRVASLVLSHPTEAVDLTITAIAERCDTSVATVARFCRSLGFTGYSEFRRALAASVGRVQVARSRFGLFESDITAEDDARAVVAKLAYHETKAIEDTAASIDVSVLDAVSDAVAAATRIDLYGVASSGLAAQDLQQKFHRIGLVSYAWSDVHLALTSAANLTPECIAIGFSHSGSTAETADALSAARSRGAATVLVTNFPSSPIAEQVDHVLVTSASETSFAPAAMSGRTAQLLVVDAIFVRVAQRLQDPEAPLRSTYDAVRAHRLGYTRRSRARSVH
jgi:DNA-binding MurR/RpiR family transcriptional regulator